MAAPLWVVKSRLTGSRTRPRVRVASLTGGALDVAAELEAPESAVPPVAWDVSALVPPVAEPPALSEEAGDDPALDVGLGCWLVAGLG